MQLIKDAGTQLLVIRREGEQAFIEGKSKDSSIYMRNTEKWQSWQRGWHTARWAKMFGDSHA